MAARAYGRETLASLPIDDDKDWKNREISNVKNLGVNEHITLLARGKKRNVYPALNRYDSEIDGWHISKDNDDIERKFWKDDFSVDTSSNYTLSSGTITLEPGVLKLTEIPPSDEAGAHRLSLNQPIRSPRYISFTLSIDPDNTLSGKYRYVYGYIGGKLCFRIYRDIDDVLLSVAVFRPFKEILTQYKNDTEYTFAYYEDGTLNVYMDGKLVGTSTQQFPEGTLELRVRNNDASGGLFEFKQITLGSSASPSYADDFATDTVSRTALAGVL